MAPRNNPRNPNDATATLSLPPVFGSSSAAQFKYRFLTNHF